MAFKPLPPQDYLRKILDYDPESGSLKWRWREGAAPQTNKLRAGMPAFTSLTPKGQFRGSIDNSLYMAHRIIWMMVHGVEPDEIDHINGNPSDNRLVNLRSVTHAENLRNTRVPVTNTSGHIGIYWCKRREKWEAKIMVGGSQIHIGYYRDFEDAVVARKAAECEHGYHANHGRARQALAAHRRQP